MKPVWIKWMSGIGTIATFAFYLNITQPDATMEVSADAMAPENDGFMPQEQMQVDRLLAEAGRIDDLEVGFVPEPEDTTDNQSPLSGSSMDLSGTDTNASSDRLELVVPNPSINSQPETTVKPAATKKPVVKRPTSGAAKPAATATPAPEPDGNLSALDQLLAEMNAATPEPVVIDSNAGSPSDPVVEWDPFADQQVTQQQTNTRRSWRSSRS